MSTFTHNAFAGFRRDERDRRAGRDVTSSLMGDPPPGRSALDRMCGQPEIPEDPRRVFDAPLPPGKRKRKGAVHYGQKL